MMPKNVHALTEEDLECHRPLEVLYHSSEEPIKTLETTLLSNFKT